MPTDSGRLSGSTKEAASDGLLQEELRTRVAELEARLVELASVIVERVYCRFHLFTETWISMASD